MTNNKKKKEIPVVLGNLLKIINFGVFAINMSNNPNHYSKLHLSLDFNYLNYIIV